jgi:hypothetical protein
MLLATSWPRLATRPRARASCTAFSLLCATPMGGTLSQSFVRVPERPSVTKRHSTAQHSTAQHSTAQHSSRAASWLLVFSSPSHYSTHKTHAAHKHKRSRLRRTHTHVVGCVAEPAHARVRVLCVRAITDAHIIVRCTLQDWTKCAYVNAADNITQPACV